MNNQRDTSRPHAHPSSAGPAKPAGTEGSAPAPRKGEVVCPFCAHHFAPGDLPSYMYCPACGKKFNPTARLDETVCLELPHPSDAKKKTVPPKPSPAKEDEAVEVEAVPDSEELPEPEPLDAEAGAIPFGDYEILSEIARGGMGVVYRARHRLLKRVVALKVLRAGDGASEDDIRRFMQEAKSAASLAHPNIVPIHDLSVFRGQHYFTMDYIDGTPLDRLIEQGELAPYRACEMILTLARAIQYAHSRGIIHRDIKPANVLIDGENRPLLTDFGLAVNLSANRDSQRMTQSGSVMGTIPYIPPEQAAGRLEQIGPRSDIYSLGALFYEMLTGRPPFTGMTQYELLQRVINHYPPMPRKLKPRLSADLETICMKCLAKEPERRYQTAAELADDCQAFLNGEIIKARPATALYRTRRFIARHPELAALGVITLALGLVILGMLNFARSTAKKLSESEEQHEKTKEDAQRLNDRVKRNWRSEFALQSGPQPNLTTDRGQSRGRILGWYAPAAVKPLPNGLEIGPGPDRRNPAVFACPARLPGTFRVKMQIQLPATGAGSPLILLGTTPNYTPSDSTRLIELSAEGTPGARLWGNNTIIAENSLFALAPGKTHTIEIVRSVEEPLLQVFVNDEQVLRFEGVTESASPDDVYICLGARVGKYRLLRMNADVLGMSREMLRSLLEMGDGLAAQSRDVTLGRKLYEQVLREDSPQDMLIHAYNGFSRSLGKTKQSVLDDCRALLENIRQSKSRRLQPGEEEYVTGLALARISPLEAVPFFQNAAARARSSARHRLAADSTYWCGPFAPAAAPQPLRLTVFNPAELFTTEEGDRGWGPLKADNRNLFRLPPPAKRDAPALYFAVQLFTLDRPAEVLCFFPESCRLWINKRPAKAEKTETPGQVIASGRFAAGDNQLLLEIPGKTAEEGFYLNTYETGVALSNIYGLLARLDEALAQLRSGNLTGSIDLLSDLQRDGTLESLASRFPAESKARGAVAGMLQKADEMLEDPKLLQPSWNLLEAIRALDDGTGGKELALRYNKLAALLDKTSKTTDADAVYQQAATLAPQWYLPLFERAKLLYRKKETRKEGVGAFSDAFRKLPESLELRLAAADFFLNPSKGQEKDRAAKIPPDPAFALEAAMGAADLSGRKNPQALTSCAQALLMLDRPEEALQYNDEARLLEETPDRAALSKHIRSRLGR